MAKHVVEVTSPTFVRGKADTIFAVEQDGSKLEELCISQGAAVWYPNGASYAKKLTWTQLAKAFDELGTHRAEKKVADVEVGKLKSRNGRSIWCTSIFHSNRPRPPICEYCTLGSIRSDK